MWNIFLYETPRGEKPVEEFIKKQNASTKAKIIHHIELLEKFGFSLGMPHVKKLVNDFYELRIRGKDEIRIIYIFKKKNIYLLHIFKKKTQKTPRKELEIAISRSKYIKIEKDITYMIYYYHKNEKVVSA